MDYRAYHYDTVGKRKVLKEFRTGEKRVIVATSALGMGVDIVDIRCIIHAAPPRTLLDYAQESGRAGRDGKRSEAVIVWDGRAVEVEDAEVFNEGQTRYAERQMTLIELYLRGIDGERACRRAVVDAYIDGRLDREGCEEGEERCDVCRGVEEVVEMEGEIGEVAETGSRAESETEAEEMEVEAEAEQVEGVR